MDCENVLELLSAALDGELTAQQQVQLDEHLTQCPSCRALQAELAGLHEACAQLEVPAPEGLKEQIMAHLPAQSAKRVAPYWRRWGAMAAAIALVALMAWQVPKFITQPTTDQTVDTVTMDANDEELPPLAAEGAPRTAAPSGDGTDGINGVVQSSALFDGVDAVDGVNAFDTDGDAAHIAPPPSAEDPASGPTAAAPGSDYFAASVEVPVKRQIVDAEAPKAYAGGGADQMAEEEAVQPLTTAGVLPDKLADTPEVAAETPEAVPFLGSKHTPVNTATTEEVMETAPETGAGNVPAEPREALVEDEPGYCGVLTLEAYHPALDQALSTGEAGGMARYILSAEAFARLVHQLDAEALSFSLSPQVGSDSDAPGLVLVPLG